MEQYTTNRGRSALAASLIGLAAVGVAIAATRRRSGTAGARARHGGGYIHQAITINRPLAQVYRSWRNLENVPRFVSHIKSEVTAAREDEAISWLSLAPSDVQHSGSV